VGQVADHYAEVIGALEKKPAVIGHSFGGLLTQIVAGQGMSVASVAIDAAPFRGVFPLPISSLRAAKPVLGNPANRHRAVPLTYDQFRYAFPAAPCPDRPPRSRATPGSAGSLLVSDTQMPWPHGARSGVGGCYEIWAPVYGHLAPGRAQNAACGTGRHTATLMTRDTAPSALTNPDHARHRPREGSEAIFEPETSPIFQWGITSERDPVRPRTRSSVRKPSAYGTRCSLRRRTSMTRGTRWRKH
jgi:pimeloyl-ACP methyl ester carboxylesterase